MIIGNRSYTFLGKIKGRSNIDLLRDDASGKLFIRKILHVHDSEVYRALLEMHPEGVPEIAFFGYTAEGLSVVEEYIDGRTLQSIIEETGPLPEEKAVRYLVELCGILAPLHGHVPAIVHRDIKPSNIIISTTGKLYLVDFDAATHYSDEKDGDTVLMGTHGYAAPEQYGFSASDPRTDVYAVGRLAQMLFRGELLPAENYTGPCEKVIKRCLSMDPTLRYKSAAELRRAFKHRIPFSPTLDLPGFRSKTLWKMVPAGLFYMFFTFGFIGDLIKQSGLKRVGDIVLFVDVILTIFVIFDYRNWSIILPFSGSPHPIVRAVSRIIFTALIVLLMQIFTGYLMDVTGLI